MNPKGGGFLSVAGTGNHAGASPSRSAGHRQDRVGCIVECDQPKGEQKGAYSLHPHFGEAERKLSSAYKNHGFWSIESGFEHC